MSAEGWLVAAAIASPVLSFAGGALGFRVSSRADDRLDRRWHREETGRTIRWAAEKAVDPDPQVRRVGFAALRALAGAELLQAEDRRFLRLIAEAAVSDQVENAPPEGDTGGDEG